MKQLIGVAMVIGSVFFGLYVGLYVCFIGGIVDIINQIKSPNAVEAMSVAWGIAKIVFSGVFGWVSFMLLLFPGIALAQSK